MTSTWWRVTHKGKMFCDKTQNLRPWSRLDAAYVWETEYRLNWQKQLQKQLGRLRISDCVAWKPTFISYFHPLMYTITSPPSPARQTTLSTTSGKKRLTTCVPHSLSAYWAHNKNDLLLDPFRLLTVDPKQDCSPPNNTFDVENALRKICLKGFSTSKVKRKCSL